MKGWDSLDSYVMEFYILPYPFPVEVLLLRKKLTLYQYVILIIFNRFPF